MAPLISASHLLLKRVYASSDAADGTRVLVDRLWPRGVSRTRAALDFWTKDVAPSTELREWFGHDPDRWEEFCSKYREELSHNIEVVGTLHALAVKGPVTLLFGERDEVHNEAAILRSFLLDR